MNMSIRNFKRTGWLAGLTLLAVILPVFAAHAADIRKEIMDAVMEGASLPLQTGPVKAGASGMESQAEIPAPAPQAVAVPPPAIPPPPVQAVIPDPMPVAAPPPAATVAKPVPPPPPDIPAVPDARAFERRLAELNRRVEAMRKAVDDRTRALEDIQNHAVKDLPENGSGLSLSERKRIAAPEERLQNISDVAPAAKEKTPVKKAAAVIKKKPLQDKSLMVRVATPKAAWVAPSRTAPLQVIKIGDTLSGIGRVEAIRQEKGKWTVVGSRGFIR
ncbi:MAG: hypothetical protein AB7H77_09155 [Bdellovibrionales bacterium]